MHFISFPFILLLVSGASMVFAQGEVELKSGNVTEFVIAQDVVELNSGQIIKCRVVKYDDGILTLVTEEGEEKSGSISKIKRITFADNAFDAVADVPEDEGDLLEGGDLIAWKLARKAAEGRCMRLSTTASSSIPKYTLDPKPRAKFMEKTETGDWVFTFPVTATYYNANKKKWVPARHRAHMTVDVTNYGSEIRVEKVRLIRK